MPKQPPEILDGILELRRKRRQELGSVFARPAFWVVCAMIVAAAAVAAAGLSGLPH